MVTQSNRESELARIDERTALMLQELRDLKANMVTRAEFNPVRAIAFGLVGVAMLALLGAMIAQVLRNREALEKTASPTPAITATAAPGTVANSPLLLAAHLPLGVGRPQRRSAASRAKTLRAVLRMVHRDPRRALRLLRALPRASSTE